MTPTEFELEVVKGQAFERCKAIYFGLGIARAESELYQLINDTIPDYRSLLNALQETHNFNLRHQTDSLQTLA